MKLEKSGLLPSFNGEAIVFLILKPKALYIFIVQKKKPSSYRSTEIHLPLTVGLSPSHTWRGRFLSEDR